MRRQSHSSAADWGEAATGSGMEFWLPGWESCSEAYPASWVSLWQSWKPTDISWYKAGRVEVSGKASVGCKTGTVKQDRFSFFYVSLPFPLLETPLTYAGSKCRELGPYWEIPEDPPSKISLGIRKRSRHQFRSVKVFPLMLCWTSVREPNILMNL